MNMLTMLQVATVLFALSALGGLSMAYVRLGRGVNPPSWLAMLHGLLAAAGLTLLAYATFSVGVPTLAACALVLFVIAALGGMTMNLAYHLHNQPLPRAILLGHAVLAATAFVLLLIVAYGFHAV